MKKYIYITLLSVFIFNSIDGQNKASIAGDLYYGFQQADKINSAGIGISFKYLLNSNYSIDFSVASIFGESRGIVPRKNTIKLTVKEYETLKGSNFYDHFLKHFSTTFDKYYTFITDLKLMKNYSLSKNDDFGFGGGISLVYFDLENIDYVYDAKFYRFGGQEEEEYTLIIPRYDRFYDLGVNVAASYEKKFKEYMIFKVNPSVNYYFKSQKLIFKFGVGIGFYLL